MKFPSRFLAFCAVLAAAGCARGPDAAAPDAIGSVFATPTRAFAALPASPAPGRVARLPDRGELVAYPGHVKRVDGAYTLYRTDVSEEHALRAIADGRLRLTTPEGQLLDVRYERHVEHPTGDWTWVGHLPGDPSAQTIITFGEKAIFGSIAQANGEPPLRLTMRDGQAWLVETDPRKLASIVNAETRPTKPDYHILPRSLLRPGVQPRAAAAAPVAAAATASAAGAATNTIDLLVGYTPGFVTAQGSVSAANTRLNYLVDVANTAFANSQVSTQVRLVHTMQVNYTDTNTNDTALEQMSGYKAGTGPVTPNSAFNALRAARETYGADLVSLVRPFKDPEQDNCGIAWLLGGGKQGIQAGQGWDDLAYSVVSDGSDKSTDGKTYYCRDETLAHEMGHNEGSAHDRDTSKGDDGVLNDPDDYGAYSYSFGYKTTATTGNFYTVMAYGDSGQTGYRVFSNPRITFCGGRACGTTTWEDNARSLTQTTPVVAGFRASQVPVAGAVRGDFQGDGKADVFWRNGSTGENTVWRSADQSTKVLLPVVAGGWKVAAIADFNGDGRSDVFWHNGGTGENSIWLSADRNTRQAVPAVTDTTWQVAGAGDFNGDGKADVLWRNAQTGANTVWNSAQQSSRRVLATVSDTHWIVAAIADFDGDGRDDVLWHHTATGANSIWRSGDSSAKQVLGTVTDTTWTIAGAGDFDGDGRADVLWRNRGTGANTLWPAANQASRRALGTLASSWSLAASGDYNGDGKDDVFWRNLSSGADVIWFSANSASTRTEGTVSNQAWQVVP